MALLLRVLLLEVIIIVGLGNCVCSGDADSISRHDGRSSFLKTRGVPDTIEGSINLGFCATWHNTTDIVVVNCPYYIANPIQFCNGSIQLVHGPEMNYEMCHYFKRTGPYCGECINGTGPAAFSNGIPCAHCSNLSPLWFFLYLLMQLLCVTILYIVCALFQLRLTSSPLNVIVYFSQVLVNIVVIHPSTYSAVVCALNSTIFDMLLTVYGIWNLDFFRYVIPPICMSSSAKSIHVLMFDYVVALYPIVLTVVLYICLTLHEQRYRVVICIWKPFQFCRDKLRRSDNMSTRESIINIFASFILLSYSKLLYTSLYFFYNAKIFPYSNTKTSIGNVLFYDPTIEYFSRYHAPYLFLSFIIIMFLLLPPFLLLIYPTKVCGRCLECCRFPRQDILQLTMDTFQGWYKDGTEGTWDYRPVSSLYMFLRIGVGIVSVLGKGLGSYKVNQLPWIFAGLFHGIIGVLFLVFRPYKKVYMNVVDGTILILFGAMSIMEGQSNPVTKGIAFLFSILPLLICILYLIWRMTKLVFPFLKNKCTQCLRKIHQREYVTEENTDNFIEHMDRVSHPSRYQPPPSMRTEVGTRTIRPGPLSQYGAMWSSPQGHDDVRTCTV